MALTKAQAARLQQIADYTPSERWPYAAFWDKSRTDLSLVKRGLIERKDKRDEMYGIAFIWHLCRITEAGRRVLSPDA